MSPDTTQLRAEIDAYYARLYSLTRDELRYTPFGVGPKEFYGEDLSGETFRVLKEKESLSVWRVSHIKTRFGGVGWAAKPRNYMDCVDKSSSWMPLPLMSTTPKS